MKKILSLILCLIMTLSLGTAAFGADEITIYVNGSVVQSELKPVIIDGNTLIPLRPVAEAMGCTVTWVAEEKGIKIESENISVRMVLNYGVIYTTKGTATTAQDLTVPPQLINGSTYIPMRPMVEALGGDVSWNGETKTINITYDSSSAESNYTSGSGIGRSFYLDSEDEAYGSYEGEMSNGKANGTGVMTWTSGSVYEGDFKDGCRHGTGTYTSKDGDVYAGQWEYGDMSGTGKLTWHTGEVYEGDFEDGTTNGKGKMIQADGCVYEGEFKDGSYSGYGTFTGPKGVYEGYWKESKREGYGKYTWTSGNMYEGNWENDHLNGQGTYTYSNGDVYVGGFKNDKFNGQGKITYADGTVEEGTWENGKYMG